MRDAHAFQVEAAKGAAGSPMSHNARAFEQLANDRNAMSALQADPQVFAAIGNNAAAFGGLAGNARQFNPQLIAAIGNNGSAFAGLTANAPWYDTTMGIAMFMGRFGYLIPVMAIAGSLAAKPKLAPSAGTFPTHGTLFVALLVGVILILGGLQYFPALALGPIVEHLAMNAGNVF